MGGYVTLNDFKNYKADVREPITTNITSKLKLYGHPILRRASRSIYIKNNVRLQVFFRKSNSHIILY
jgi:hypothetical protein